MNSVQSNLLKNVCKNLPFLQLGSARSLIYQIDNNMNFELDFNWEGFSKSYLSLWAGFSIRDVNLTINRIFGKMNLKSHIDNNSMTIFNSINSFVKSKKKWTNNSFLEISNCEIERISCEISESIASKIPSSDYDILILDWMDRDKSFPFGHHKYTIPAFAFLHLEMNHYRKFRDYYAGIVEDENYDEFIYALEN